MSEPPKQFDRIHPTLLLQHISFNPEKSYFYFVKDYLRDRQTQPPHKLGVDKIQRSPINSNIFVTNTLPSQTPQLVSLQLKHSDENGSR